MTGNSAQESKNTGLEPTALEGGVSLGRTDEEGALLRRRLERPGRAGRVVLAFIGAVTAGAGVADWITTRSPVGIAIGVFGAVLILLGLAQHVLYRRDLEHWPTDVVLWDEGIELILPNGEVRGASWSDPDLALQLISRKAPPPTDREYPLLWLRDSKIPAVEITSEGFDRISRTAADQGLQIKIAQRGSRIRGTKMIHIYPLPPPSTSSVTTSADAES